MNLNTNKKAIVDSHTIDDTPSVLPPANLLAIDDDRFFGTDDGEWNDILDLCIQGTLLFIQFIVVVRVHLKIVERELFLDPFFECRPLLQRQGVGLCNDGDNVNYVGQFFQDNNVDGFKADKSVNQELFGFSVQRGHIRMTGGLDEEETAMDTGVLDVTFSLCSKFFAEVGGMLIFDVLDNRVPTIQCVSLFISQAINAERQYIPSIVIHLITIAWGIDNIQPEADAVLLNNYPKV